MRRRNQRQECGLYIACSIALLYILIMVRKTCNKPSNLPVVSTRAMPVSFQTCRGRSVPQSSRTMTLTPKVKPTEKQRAFREYLNERQFNQENCRRRYVFDQGLNPRIHTGLGSRVTIMQATFANTILQDETVYTVPGEWLWTDPVVCPRRDHTCYFQRLHGPCDGSIDRFEKNKNPPAPKWNTLVDTWGLSPFQLASELIYFLLQPNDDMVADIEVSKKRMRWDELPRPVLAIHVRHGKKIWEGKYYSNEDFMKAALEMKKRHGFQSIFLLTDDLETVEYFEANAIAAGFKGLASLDDPEFVQHGWKESEKHLRDAAQRVARGTNSGCTEAVTTLLNILIASEADGFVGVFNSNLSRTIVKLMMAINGGTMPPNVSLDDFYTKKDKGSCGHEYLCGKGRKILVETVTDSYPMSTSIIS